MSIQHETMDEIERAYQRSSLLRKRREVLEKWSEYLTSLVRARDANRKRQAAYAEVEGERTISDVENWNRGSKEDWFCDDLDGG